MANINGRVGRSEIEKFPVEEFDNIDLWSRRDEKQKKIGLVVVYKSEKGTRNWKWLLISGSKNEKTTTTPNLWEEKCQQGIKV